MKKFFQGHDADGIPQNMDHVFSVWLSSRDWGRSGLLILLAIGVITLAGGCASGRGFFSARKTAFRTPSETLRPETLSIGNVTQTTRPVEQASEEAIIRPVAYESKLNSESELESELEAELGLKISTNSPPELEQTTLTDTIGDSIAGSGGWTFDDAVRATLLADPQLQAGMAAVRESHADWWTSSLPPNPELGISGGALPFKTLTPERPGGPPQLDIEIAMPVDWFLFAKRAAAMESARIGVQMSEAQYADLIRQRVTETAVAYYDLLEAKEQVALARKDVEVLEQLESVIVQARQAGGLPELDRKRVELDLLQSRQTLMESEASLVSARAILWSRLGRDEACPAHFDVTGNLNFLPKITPLPLEGAYNAAVQNRPDIRSLRLGVEQSGANCLVERRNAFPEVTPAFGYSHQYQEAIGDPDWDGWNISLGVNVPVFDRNQGNRAKAAATLNRNRQELASGLLDLRAEVTEADQNLRTALQRTGSVAGDQVRLAADVRDRIIDAYRAGGLPLIDVLNAETSYRETFSLYLSSRADMWRAFYLYQSALGESSWGENTSNENVNEN